MPHTTSQIQEIIKREKYPYYCLQNADGGLVVPYNTKLYDAAHLKKIIASLDKGSSLPDGLYFVIAMQSRHAKAVKMKYDIVKGKLVEKTETAAAVETFTGRTFASGNQLPSGYSIADLLKLERELGELRASVAAKDKIIEGMEKDYAELEDELAAMENEKSDGNMGEGAPDETTRMMQQIAMFKQILTGGDESPAAIAENAKEPIKISYQMIFDLLKGNPELVDKLSKDLENYYASQQQSEPAAQFEGHQEP